MTHAQDTKGVGRRGFIGALAGLSAAAAVTGAAGSVEAQESTEEMTKARYQETAHVLKFYEVNRY